MISSGFLDKGDYDDQRSDPYVCKNHADAQPVDYIYVSGFQTVQNSLAVKGNPYTRLSRKKAKNLPFPFYYQNAASQGPIMASHLLSVIRFSCR